MITTLLAVKIAKLNNKGMEGRGKAVVWVLKVALGAILVL